MEEGYIVLTTDETAAFDLKKFLTDLKLEGLLSMDFVLEFYPEPYDEDRQYAIWQLIQDREEESGKEGPMEVQDDCVRIRDGRDQESRSQGRYGR